MCSLASLESNDDHVDDDDVPQMGFPDYDEILVVNDEKDVLVDFLVIHHSLITLIASKLLPIVYHELDRELRFYNVFRVLLY